jgi:hypothetical protein
MKMMRSLKTSVLLTLAGLIEDLTGEPYEAVFLPQEEVDAILAGS